MRTMLVVLISVVVAWVGLMTAGPVYGHHSFAAEFDANKPIKVEGTLTKVEWINPHAWFHVAVKNPDGTVEEWMFEAGPPNALTRRGWNKNSIPTGTEVVAEGYMSKGIPRRANGRVMTFTDGRHLFVGSSGTGAPLDGKDLSEK